MNLAGIVLVAVAANAAAAPCAKVPRRVFETEAALGDPSSAVRIAVARAP